MSEEKEDKKQKDLEVVTGSVDDLDISPVFQNSTIAKPRATKQKPKNIVIPKVKKDKKHK